MKFIAAIIFGACLQVSANGYSQRLSLSVKEVPIAIVFDLLSKQSGYRFFYNAEQTSRVPPVTITIHDANIHEVLATILSNQPLTYELVDKVIVIKERKGIVGGDRWYNARSNPLPKKRIGKVTNAQGEPLSGANIVIKRTGKGTITNAKGEFSLDLNDDDLIVISYIGYQTKQMRVGDAISLFIQTDVATNPLDVVVVQGYGETTRRLATGNIAKVTGEEISKQPILNPLQALQGRVAGLNVTQTSGYGSAPFKVELRGRNTINELFTSDPLYIIDGIPIAVSELGGSLYNNGSVGYLQNGFTGPANGQSPLFSMNPSEIESIEVLKDADATAIYGSRGANGVILITTKKGRAGKSKFEINIYHGISKITRYWDMLNTPQYLEMRKEAFTNSGDVPDINNAYDLVAWDTTKYTNWQKLLLGNTGKITDIQTSLSGGDSRTTFRIGAGYHYQTDILAYSGADKRGSFHLNLNHHLLNQKLTIGITSTYSFAKSNMISMPSALDLPPNAPGIFDNSGNLNYPGWDPAQYTFPFAQLLQPYTSKTSNFNNGLVLSYQLVKGLTVQGNLGYSNAVVEQVSLQPKASQDPTNNPKGSAQFGNNNIKNWIFEPQIEFSKPIGKMKFNALIGSTIQSNATSGLYVLGTGYTNDNLTRTISNAPNKYATERVGEYHYAAIFGRIGFNWANKYLVNLSGRGDGSSRFGPNKQFGSFGAIGIAWVFSEENWIKNLNKRLDIFSFGKIRTSFGTTGSDAIRDYQYLTQWSSSYQGLSFPIYNGLISLFPTQHSNPDFQWQLNKKLESSIELGFFRDRILLSASYYRNRCDNQLVDFPTPSFTGFPNVLANSPASVQNSGWELTFTTKIIDKKLQWSVSGNIGINKNKLLAYPNIEQSPYATTLVVGQSLSLIKLLHFTGVDSETGLYTFEEKNKDGVIDVNPGVTDDRFYYDLAPQFSGGFSSKIDFKNIQLGLYFNFIKQRGFNALYSGNIPGYINNQPSTVLSRWRKINDEATYSRFTTVGEESDFNFSSYSDGRYTDASFIRLQNAYISYNIPKTNTKKFSLGGCTVYIQGQNLFIVTNYKGLDPEVQNFGALPPSRECTIGIRFHF